MEWVVFGHRNQREVGTGKQEQTNFTERKRQGSKANTRFKMEGSSSLEDSGYITAQAKFLNRDDSLIFSTRNQNLQSVMMAQGKFSASFKRRLSVDHDARDEEEGQGGPGSSSAEREGRRMKERRRSSGAKTLMTPEMRSLRLIGNSNPQYQWSR